MSNPHPILEDFLTRDELASELRRSPRTLDRWEGLGIRPSWTLVGPTIHYKRESVQRWLAAQEHYAQGTGGAAAKSGARARV